MVPNISFLSLQKSSKDSTFRNKTSSIFRNLQLLLFTLLSSYILYSVPSSSSARTVNAKVPQDSNQAYPRGY